MVQKAVTLKIDCDHPATCGMKYLPTGTVIRQLMVLATWCVRIFKFEDEIQDGYAAPLGRIHLAA